MFAVPMDCVVRVHASSGTTGKPTVAGYTRKDIDTWAELGEINVDPSSLNLKAGIFGAEPWSENMREEIENKLDIDALDIYGIGELIGPAVANECVEAKHGLHVFEDHFLPEIINPDTGG